MALVFAAREYLVRRCPDRCILPSCGGAEGDMIELSLVSGEWRVRMLRIENGSTGVYVAVMKQYVSSLYLLMIFLEIEPKESHLRELSIRTGGMSIDGRRCRNISEYKHMQSEA